MMLPRYWTQAALGLLLLLASGVQCATEPDWETAKVVELARTQVTVSKPVLVDRSADRLWFPMLIKLGDGRTLAVMSIDQDRVRQRPLAQFCLSTNGGLSWEEISIGRQPGSSLRLRNGDCLLLPVYLRSHPQGMTGPYQIIPEHRRYLLEPDEKPLIVTGLPRRPKTVDLGDGTASFGFNGQTVELEDDSYLATLYGQYVGDSKYHLIAVTSRDGRKWQYQSTIATPGIIPYGSSGEGPCESAIARLDDGRLMCIFRIGSGLTYGQTWSSDEGKTWSKPEIDPQGNTTLTMRDRTARSVQPSLAVLKSGIVVLSGGRPGVSVWLNEAGDGRDWSRIDLSALHNASHPGEPHVFSDTDVTKHSTSGYTEVVALRDGNLLVIYDRLRGGWENAATLPSQTNSVWVVRLTIKAKDKHPAAERPPQFP